MVINGSVDITNLDAQVTWDISGTSPFISLVNLSTGNGLANVSWWIVATSPSGTLIHEGTESSPDMIGNWSTKDITDPWPQPFGQIEWSGPPYQLILFAKDSNGNIYSVSKTVNICRPVGNTPMSQTPYGQASTYVRVKCEEAGIFFQNQTSAQYQGQQGNIVSSVLRVIYPLDPTYTIPTPFQISNFTSALVPITYSSDNYQFAATQVYDYEFGDAVIVRIKYQQLERFPVLCNIDLCPLACEITRLISEVESGNCNDAQDANRKLGLINSKFALVIMGKLEPLCGVDVVALINEIQEIGGFSCDCCNANTGIIPAASSVVGGYNFLVNSTCGDISGNVSVMGNNITFNLADVKYVFSIYPGSPMATSAFSVIPSTSGCTKTYYLNIDVTQLAEDILNTISTNGGLVNLFNSIVSGGAGAGELIVDGSCIFSTNQTCNYTFGLANIPATTTFALLTNIKIGIVNNVLSFSFNQTNLSALQAYLNGLGYGTFVVTNAGSGNITITSTANTNDIVELDYKISATPYIATLQKNCTGSVPLPANEVVQKIIYYVCALNDAQIGTSQSYTISYIDSNGQKQSVVVEAGSTLETFITTLLQYQTSTVDNLKDVTAVTCESVKSIFATNSTQITANDFVFITKGGGICSKGNFLDVFNYMLAAGISSNATRDLFCAFVTQCAQGLTCAPYTFFDVLVTTYDAACTEIVGIEFTLN